MGAELKLTTQYVYGTDAAASSYNQLNEIRVTGQNMVTGAPRTRTTTFGYDADGVRVTSVSDAIGTVTRTYDPTLEAMISEVDPNGVGVDFVVDSLGRTRMTIPDRGEVTGRTISAAAGAGLKIVRQRSVAATSDGPCPTSTLNQYGHCLIDSGTTYINALGLPDQSSDVGFDGTSYTTYFLYDPQGRLRARSNPTAAGPVWTVFEYDGLDRIQQITNPDDSAQYFEYPDYFTVSRTDEEDNHEEAVLNLDGRIEEFHEFIDSARDVSTVSAYEPFGQLKSSSRVASNGDTRQTTFTYDVRGRRVGVSRAETGTITQSYDAFGEVWHTQDALHARTITHDIVGRPVRDADDADPNDWQTYAWDTAAHGLGRLASSTRMPDAVTRSYTYDVFGDIKTRTLQVPDHQTAAQRTYTVAQRYDGEGRPLVTTYPSLTSDANAAATVRASYNRAGYLFQLTDRSTNQLYWSQLESTPTRAVEAAGDQSRTTSTFDPAMLRLATVQTEVNAVPVQAYSYEYNADGNLWRRRETILNSLEEMEYDGVGRLTTWIYSANSTDSGFTRSYTYNDFGDLTRAATYVGTQQTPTVDDVYGLNAQVTGRTIPSAVATFGTFSYDYDALGRRLAKKWTEGSDTVSINTTYNQWNLPTATTQKRRTAAGTETSSARESIRYDAGGTRVLRADATASTVTYYVDGDFEHRTNSIVGTNEYVVHVYAGGRIVAEITQTAASGGAVTSQFKYPHQDLLDSTTVTTGAGAPVRAFYEPFGALVAQ